VKDPKTPAEWQEAVNLAEVMSRVHSARLYGLITGGPNIDVARCDQLLRQGSLRGYRPDPRAVDHIITGLAGG
jgi:hypothetical protein